MTVTAAHLRARAQGVAQTLPPLLVRAERLAMTIVPGAHGRRRAGPGEEFWQYRQMQAGEGANGIDWRRSARSDATYLRQTEWEAPRTVTIWSDGAAAMNYPADGETKRQRADLLGMALCVLLDKGGERFGEAGGDARPSSGRKQLEAMALALSSGGVEAEFGLPPAPRVAHAVQVLLSDFLGPGEALEQTLARIGERGEPGVLLQILDESEESFPFDGRTEFKSIGGGMSFETQRARSLRSAYLTRLEQRRAMLRAFCQRTGWRMNVHRVQEPPRAALTWLHTALGRIA